MKSLLILSLVLSMQPFAFGDTSYQADENHLPESEIQDIQKEQQRVDAEASDLEDEYVQKQERRNRSVDAQPVEAEGIDPEYDEAEEEYNADEEEVVE